MTLSRMMNGRLSLALVLVLFVVACHSKPPATPPPPPNNNVAAPVPAPAPTITLRAQPATIDRGGATTLQWEARNAASVTITPGVGDVPVTGNRSISPTSSVSYQATATGPGGTATDVARVTVNIPAAPPATGDTNTRGRTPVGGTDIPPGALTDILFDYDKAEIRADMAQALQGDVNWLKANANVRVTIEGHCDDRGSEEYNLGLGDRRANALKEYLVSQGIPAARLSTVSYGEEKPVCREETEACFEKNRRAHIAAEAR
jgi:peptidoglycan-associated lipoprotein